MRHFSRQRFYAIYFGIVLAFVVVEALLRIFWGDPSGALQYGFFPDSPYRFDGTIGNRLKPDWHGEKRHSAYITRFEVNNEGFRSSAAYTFGGVAVIGDSFVEALQVPEGETFVKLLETDLDGVQVQNYGISGIGIPSYVQLYRQYVRQHQPKIVIVCVFAGNDIRNASPELEPDFPPQYVRDSDGSIIDMLPYKGGATPEVLADLDTWLVRHMALYRYIKVNSQRSAAQTAGGFPADWAVYQAEWSPVYESAWQDAEWGLRMLIHEIRAEGSTPMLVVIPGQEIIYAWERVMEQAGEQVKTQVNEHVKNLAAELEVTYVDATPALEQAAANGERLYIPQDGHLTATGHQIVAAVLRDALNRLP